MTFAQFLPVLACGSVSTGAPQESYDKQIIRNYLIELVGPQTTAPHAAGVMAQPPRYQDCAFNRRSKVNGYTSRRALDGMHSDFTWVVAGLATRILADQALRSLKLSDMTRSIWVAAVAVHRQSFSRQRHGHCMADPRA
jgi:hypothetical protein